MDLKRMLSDLRAERERIDKAIAALQQLDSTPSQGTARSGRPAGRKATAASSAQPKRGRRKMSAAGRKAISEAAKKRWADQKKAGKGKPAAS